MKKGNKFYSHPSAVIDRKTAIGKGSRIWHFSHIIKGSRIGDNCKIGQNVVIGPDVAIGNNVKIQNNVSIYKGVAIEDDVFCGPSCVFTNVYNPRSFIPRMDDILKTTVKKGATIGANATIICGTCIEEYAFIGAGSVVTKDVPAYALCYGNPARVKGWICACGVKLLFKKTKAHCLSCAADYKKEEDRVTRLL